MEKAGVPGLSCAILNDSQVVYANTFGVKNRKTGEPLYQDTIFTGASLSKTIFAYTVMQLVEEGLLDLNRPLQEYLARPLPSYPNYVDLEGDERYRKITARMCLSHTTGFPNWRWFNEDNRLRFDFDPGELADGQDQTAGVVHGAHDHGLSLLYVEAGHRADMFRPEDGFAQPLIRLIERGLSLLDSELERLQLASGQLHVRIRVIEQLSCHQQRSTVEQVL